VSCDYESAILRDLFLLLSNVDRTGDLRILLDKKEPVVEVFSASVITEAHNASYTSLDYSSHNRSLVFWTTILT
jgi:hypothetical protein